MRFSILSLTGLFDSSRLPNYMAVRSRVTEEEKERENYMMVRSRVTGEETEIYREGERREARGGEAERVKKKARGAER